MIKAKVKGIGLVEVNDEQQVVGLSLADTPLFEKLIQDKQAPWTSKQDVFLACLASLYGLKAKDVEFTLVEQTDLDVLVEPDQKINQ